MKHLTHDLVDIFDIAARRPVDIALSEVMLQNDTSPEGELMADRLDARLDRDLQSEGVHNIEQLMPEFFETQAELEAWFNKEASLSLVDDIVQEFEEGWPSYTCPQAHRWVRQNGKLWPALSAYTWNGETYYR